MDFGLNFREALWIEIQWNFLGKYWDFRILQKLANKLLFTPSFQEK
jgi:hypothetical protein